MVTKTHKQAVVPLHHEQDDPTIKYPESDGELLADNKFQAVAMVDSFSALEVYFAGSPEVYIGIDQLLYYILNDPTASVAPDLFAVFGAHGSHPRRSWIVSREGGIAPTFVLEIASESTWRRDATTKRAIYAQMGVAEYWRFDPEGAHYPVPLIGERLVSGEYEPIAVETDADGILRGHSDVLGLDLCVRQGDEEFEGRALLVLRLYDPATGEWLRSHQESEDERLAERQRAVSAEDRALAERQRAAAAQDLAAAAQQREAAAQEREAAAQERIRQLEAQMRRHGITPNDD